MKTVYTFLEQLEVGKKGEQLIFKSLESRPETISVFDVSQDKEYQKVGIDALWVTREPYTGFPLIKKIDIKTDAKYAKTGNLFLETLSSKNKTGNFLTSAAEMFIYVDPVNEKAFFLPTYPLRLWYLRNKQQIEHKVVRNKGYESEGFCITPELLETCCGAYTEDIAL